MINLNDLAAAAQLDEESTTGELLNLINQIHQRLNIHVGIMCDLSAENDRQDTALTEAESRIADLEAANLHMYELLAAQAGTLDAIRLTLARNNVRC